MPFKMCSHMPDLSLDVSSTPVLHHDRHKCMYSLTNIPWEEKSYTSSKDSFIKLFKVIWIGFWYLLGGGSIHHTTLFHISYSWIRFSPLLKIIRYCLPQNFILPFSCFELSSGCTPLHLLIFPSFQILLFKQKQ